MSEQEFHDQVLASLSRLETHMGALIGEDSREGRIPKLERDVEELQKASNKAMGYGAALLLGFQYLLNRWFR